MTGRFTEEQDALVDTVRALLGRHADHASLRRAMDSESGYDEKLWRLLCEQVGVAALAIPERYGGIGATAIESHLVLEQLGTVLAPTPMLGSVILGATTLLESGDEQACEHWLPRLADGSATAALAWASPSGWRDCGIAADSDDSLTGTAHYVLDGHAADVLLVFARTPNGTGCYEVDPRDARVEQQRGMDPTRRFSTVRLDGVRGRRLDAADASAMVGRIRDVACTALSAEQTGAAQRCLDDTVEYTGARVQFGRPIGSFQALKHRMADMYALVQTARSASYAATFALATESTTFSEDAAVAKVHCSQAFRQVTAEAVQLHGGIAITWEHDTQLYFKRAHADSQLFGPPEQYLAGFIDPADHA